MQTFALVGRTGTGKSFRALDLAQENNLEAVIDDGLLISKGRILAGSSAKHESTKIASVKRAIFMDSVHCSSIKDAIRENSISSIIILGTSDKMVGLIAERLGLLPIVKTFYIEDIASPKELETASIMRNKYGKHIIPAPAFEVKKQFSGYFLKSLISSSRRGLQLEKTVIRPSYSYLGNFRISPKVFVDICSFEISKFPQVAEVLKVNTISLANGYIDITIDISLNNICIIPELAEAIQGSTITAIESTTSITVNQVNIFVKNIRGKIYDKTI